MHQALTWSEYKKCNTLKYLIAISPDGLIIFISGGYEGRVSDAELFDKSGIMNVLPEKCAVIALYLNKYKLFSPKNLLNLFDHHLFQHNKNLQEKKYF